MTCNTHIRTRVAFHVLTNTISLTHTHTNAQTPFPCFSDSLAGISWGCSLCMSFSHILPLWLWVTLIWWAERKTDRQTERERESNQADTWSDAAKQRVVVRQRDRLRGSGARTWIFILPRTSRLHSNIKPGSIELQWKKGKGQVKKASVV